MHLMILALSAVLLTAFVPAASAQIDPTSGKTSQLALAGTSQIAATPAKQRRGVWYAIGRSPTQAELTAAPAHYSVVILNSWETAALKRIKQLDPSVKVLMYKCLSSTRPSADKYTFAKPTGVGYAEAQRTNPRWFATDTTGARIEWRSYPGHWQMAVWDRSYQQRWTDNVTGEVVRGGWDGVLADNDFATLRYYSPRLLAGTTTAAETDAKIRAGLDGMVALAGSSLAARGKLFVPNLAEARLHPGRWSLHSRYGGALEEHFVHWGQDASTGFLADWPNTGWVQQTAEMATPGMSLAITRAAPTDRRSLLYGYGSLLVRGDTTSYWSPSTTAAGTYTIPERIPEMSWAIGRALSEGSRLDNGAWTRTFEGAFVIVNPTMGSVQVPVASGFVGADGRPVSTVQLGPTSAVLLRRR
jgi:Hypothetical glycosyl hydrolase family 15